MWQPFCLVVWMLPRLMACSLHPGRREPSVCRGYHQRPCQLAHGLITWAAEVCLHLNILMPEQIAYTLLTAFLNLGLQKKTFEILLTQKPGKMIFDRNTALIYDSNPNEVISVPADVQTSSGEGHGQGTVLAIELTHWGRGNIDAVSQTTFSNACSSMKIVAY